MGIRFSREILNQIVQESGRVHPHEACGLLIGEPQDPKRVVRAEVAANVAADPLRHFEIDPAALFAAMRAARAGEGAIIGYWHSHPSGDAAPSATDAAMAAPDGRIWLIVAGDRATAWRAGHSGVHGRFEPVSLEID